MIIWVVREYNEIDPIILSGLWIYQTFNVFYYVSDLVSALGLANSLKLVSFPAFPINLSDIINILMTSFSRSVLYLTYPRFFPLIYMAKVCINQGKKLGPLVTARTSNAVSAVSERCSFDRMIAA